MNNLKANSKFGKILLIFLSFFIIFGYFSNSEFGSYNAEPNNDFSEQLDLEMHHQGVLIPKNMREVAAAFMAKREPLFQPRD